jgi:glutamyl/glutaminyl-tRNA synthetase
MDLEKLTQKCLPYLEKAGLIKKAGQKISVNGELLPVNGYLISQTGEIVTFDYLKKVIGLEQERLKRLSEIGEITEFFFQDKLDYQPELLIWKKMSLEEVKKNLDTLDKILSKIAKFDQESLKEALMPLTKKYGSGELLWPLRAALTGHQASPSPFEVAEVLGKEKTLKRIREAKALLES